MILTDVPAPAKLNLFLHITGRREDGYHLLQSVFMLIDWTDRLHFDRRVGGQLSREDLTTPLPEDDLILRAARALQTASGTSWGAHIAVHKDLPAQAGMGGGSSDAATTLLALNRLWALHWPLERLLPLGLALGADVPFFLGGHNAWVEGIGERMLPVTLPAGRFAVVKPDQGLETARIFRDPALERDCKAATMADFAAAPFGFGRNVLQPVAQRVCPAVTDALQWLSTRGLQARMTGSGSAVFAPCPDDWVMDALPAGWQGRVCSNLEHHPLAGWVTGTGYR
jgi:4-diphosphocytidyl-2-C-methyl-D-erythritol kinase